MANDVDIVTRRTKGKLRTASRKYVEAHERMFSLEMEILSLFRSFIRISGSGSQTEYAEELGISKSMLSEMVSGNRGLGISTARKIAGIK